MIKKYADFIKESHSKTVKLNSEDVSLFTSEPLLQKLVADKKVSLFDDEVKYDESDIQTKEVLDQYLELPGKVEEKVGDFNSFNEELLAGHMGAVHSATRNMGGASGEEPSDKADEFSLSICTNPLYKRFANYNYKLKNVEFEKVEPKKGFISKLFSGSSAIEFTFSKVKDNSDASLTVKLKGDKFILANSTTTEDVMATIPNAEQAKKFLDYLLGQSQWKDELTKNFENIKESLTVESFK
jgi:hypothetical protein